MKKLCAVLCMLVMILPMVGLADEVRLTKVTLLPHWIPQAQFAGYMMALEKGFYRQAGIDLNLLKGGPGNPPFPALDKGEITFCTDWVSSGIKERAAGLKLVNIGQIIQRSALMLLAKKSSGITSIASLDGKKVGLWGGDFQIQPLALFKMYHLQVETVPLYSTINLFLKGAVDAITAMWYNEYHLALNSGLEPDELTLLSFSDFGLNFPEDGLYCLEETYRSNPDLCSRLLQASLKGWLYAFENREETLDVVMRHATAANTGTNRSHQRWMLARMKDIILPDGDTEGLGKLKIKDYEVVGETMMSLHIVDTIPPYQEFYRGPQ